VENLNSGTVWEMTNFAQVITLIGAGGKSTTLQALTTEIQAHGEKVIATTTTKVYPLPFQGVWRDKVLPPPADMEYPCFWHAGIIENDTVNRELSPIKWLGPSVERIDQVLRSKEGLDCLSKEANWVIEGDGARGKKLKCWDLHEPQIPLESQCAILVIHGGLWGKALVQEDVHRLEKCPGLAGEVWNEEKAVEYILNSPVFYPQYQKFFWIIFFNEYKEFKSKDLENSYLNIRQLLQSKARSVNLGPVHLRVASGNIREGKLRWYDLW
jgi:probable selenium-dependent hydroxylase accessory protein YqeC